MIVDYIPAKECENEEVWLHAYSAESEKTVMYLSTIKSLCESFEEK